MYLIPLCTRNMKHIRNRKRQWMVFLASPRLMEDIVTYKVYFELS